MKKSALLRKFSDRLKSSIPGLPPGTEIKPGRKQKDRSSFRLITYSKNQVTVRDPVGYEDWAPDTPETVSWLHISGLADHESILKYLNEFKAHPLLIEDIFNVMHRPKFEDGSSYLFLTLKYPKVSEDKEYIELEQISILCNTHQVISITEDDLAVLKSIEERIHNPQARFRRLRGDYLFYALTDLIVDLYKPALESLNDMQLELEEEILEKNDPDQLAQIQKIRKSLILFRQHITPLKESIQELLDSKPETLDQNQVKYFKDILDHIRLAQDQLQSIREQNANLTETFLGLQGHRMNEVMKTLTIIATIFIPLTFIAGIYGMNFEWMPELTYRLGYPAVWIVMLLTVALLIRYFRRKRWL